MMRFTDDNAADASRIAEPPATRAVRPRAGTACGFVLVAFVAFACANPDADISKESERLLTEAGQLYRARKFAAAARRLERLRAQGVQTLEAEVLYAKTLFYRRDFAGAEAVLRKTLAQREHNPYASLWLGRVLMVQDQRLDEALALFRDVVRRDPDNHTAYYYLARCLELKRDYRSALTAYTRATTAEVPLSRAHLHTAQLLLRVGLKERAALHAKRVLAVNSSPKDVEAARGLAGGSP